MSRWVTLALTSVSVLALTVASPAAYLAGPSKPSKEIGSWCC